MNNNCKPFNDQTLSSFVDISIFLEGDKYAVYGLTEEFKTVILGIFGGVLEAYGCALEYGFELYEYNVTISPFENRTVSFTLD